MLFVRWSGRSHAHELYYHAEGVVQLPPPTLAILGTRRRRLTVIVPLHIQCGFRKKQNGRIPAEFEDRAMPKPALRPRLPFEWVNTPRR